MIACLPPDIVFDINLSILIVLMALFGVGRSWAGPLSGAAVLTLGNEFPSIFIKTEVARVLYGAVFMALILYRPSGGVVFFQKRRFSRRREDRG